MALRRRRRKVALPGHVRCTLQLYVAGKRFYGQIPGLSLSRIRVANEDELKRLWKELENVIDGAEWRTAVDKFEPALVPDGQL